VDNDALAPVVHAERQRVPTAVDELEAEELLAEPGPVIEALRADAEVTKGIERHVALSP